VTSARITARWRRRACIEKDLSEAGTRRSGRTKGYHPNWCLLLQASIQ
jgi:hypothetical protein